MSEQPYLEVPVTTVERKYNPNYGDNRICTCGHAYYRHFDSYDNMAPVGCKYCGCYTFLESKATNIRETMIDVVNNHISRIWPSYEDSQSDRYIIGTYDLANVPHLTDGEFVSRVLGHLELAHNAYYQQSQKDKKD